jgi:hypothetical protein
MDDLAGTVNTLQYANIPNPVLNSCFDVWQRGTSIANTASYTQYSADQWQVNRAGLATGATISRQATADTTNLPYVQYCARVQRDSGNTNTGAIYFLNTLETANSIPLAGKQVTVSFYARAGANFSAASNVLNWRFDYGTGTNQSLGGSFTGQAAVITSTATLTTTWQRFTATATVPATATELGFYSWFTPVGTAGANDYYEITGVQYDQSSIALPVRRNGSTYQAELAACQRYYVRFTPPVAYTAWCLGVATATTTANMYFGLPVAMRVAPSVLDYSTLGVASGGGSVISVSSATVGYTSTLTAEVSITATGLVLGAAYQLFSNNSLNAYVGWSAEL